MRTFIARSMKEVSARFPQLLRSQSVVSETISNLEEQIGVQLFDDLAAIQTHPSGIANSGSDARR